MRRGKEIVLRANGANGHYSDGTWQIGVRHSYDLIREHVPSVPTWKEIWVNEFADGSISVFATEKDALRRQGAKDDLYSKGGIHQPIHTAIRYIECPEGFPAVIPPSSEWPDDVLLKMLDQVWKDTDLVRFSNARLFIDAIKAKVEGRT